MSGVSPELLVFFQERHGKTTLIMAAQDMLGLTGEATYITLCLLELLKPLGQVAKYLGNPQTFEDEMRVSPSTAAFDLS